jgi:hypothetical protein
MQYRAAFRLLADQPRGQDRRVRLPKGLVAGTNVTVIVIWGQGENGNSLATSQANYTSGLNTVIGQSRTAGFTGKWFIAKQTYVTGTTSSAVQAAQAAAPNGTTIFAGPNADALAGKCLWRWREHGLSESRQSSLVRCRIVLLCRCVDHGSPCVGGAVLANGHGAALNRAPAMNSASWPVRGYVI